MRSNEIVVVDSSNSCKMLKKIGVPKQLISYNISFLAPNYNSAKKLEKIKFLFQLNPKQLEFFQELLVTEKIYISLLLGLHILT